MTASQLFLRLVIVLGWGFFVVAMVVLGIEIYRVVEGWVREDDYDEWARDLR